MDRTATLNVPCTGKFDVRVQSDGSWYITLNHKDGSQYVRFSTSTVETGVFFDPLDVFNTFEIPDWMLDCLKDKVHELQYVVNRNSIVTPNIVTDYVQ